MGRRPDGLLDLLPLLLTNLRILRTHILSRKLPILGQVFVDPVNRPFDIAIIRLPEPLVRCRT
ncbi:MAG: hypothetical protein ACOCTG_00825, partial [Bacteroidota bacterium]